MRYYFNNAEISPRQGDSIASYIWEGAQPVPTEPWIVIDGTLHITSDSVTGDLGSAGLQPWWYLRNDITSIKVHSGVTYIGNRLFQQLTNVVSAQLPDTLVSLMTYAFANDTSLESITIPASVRTLGTGIFESDSGITNLIVENGVSNLSSYFCYSCSSLQSITIPVSVVTLNERCLAGCSSLTSITYGGTTAQWNAITKKYYWNNSTGNYTIHCTDGDLSKT